MLMLSVFQTRSSSLSASKSKTTISRLLSKDHYSWLWSKSRKTAVSWFRSKTGLSGAWAGSWPGTITGMKPASRSWARSDCDPDYARESELINSTPRIRLPLLMGLVPHASEYLERVIKHAVQTRL